MRAPAPSSVNTLSVPAQGESPALLARATRVPLRVVVRNTGGALVLIAYDTPSLQVENPMSGTFRLAVGQESTFVLMAEQSLHAAANGAGGIASVAASEALPQVWMEA